MRFLTNPRALLRFEAFFALLILIALFYALNYLVPAYYGNASDRVKILFLGQLGDPPMTLGWLAIVGILILPDIALVGAAGSARIKTWGVAFYNICHSYAVVGFVLAPLLWFWFMRGETTAWGACYFSLRIVVLWFIHIAVDRIVAYGLRTGWGRDETHLSGKP